MDRKLVVRAIALTALSAAILLVGCDKSEEASSKSAKSESKSADDSSKKTPQKDDKSAEKAQKKKKPKPIPKLRANLRIDDLVLLEQPADVPDSFSSGLAEAYGHYVTMTEAFAKDDAKAATAAAKKLQKTVEKLEPKQLEGDAKKAWTSQHKRILSSLAELTASEQLAPMRSQLVPITEALYTAIESLGGVDGKVHVAYCPMAFDGDGAYWLADQREIQNPYLGSKKPTCGTVTETIQ